MNVLIRRDGRVEIHGKLLSENAAAARLQELGYGKMVGWMRSDCQSGRAFCDSRGMVSYNSNGVER